MRRIIFFFLVSMVLPRLDAIRAQSFEPATWILEAEDVIRNYGLDADAGGSVYMSGLVQDGKGIRWSDGTIFVPERNENFLARIAADGNVRWVRPGALSVRDYYISIHTVVAQGPYVWTNEGATRGGSIFNTRWNTGELGGILINRYSDAGDSLQATYLAGPVDYNMYDGPAYILGLGGDDAGNTYVAGYYLDTLRLGSGHLLVPYVPAGSDPVRSVFLASYSREGNVRWAHRMVSYTGDDGYLPINDILYEKTPARPSFDVGAAGNTYLGGFFSRGTVFAEGQPDSLRLEESDAVVVSFDATGKLRWLRTASDLGVEADYLAFTDDRFLGPRNTAVPWILSVRDDGELALNWTVGYGSLGIIVTVGDTTFTVPFYSEGGYLDFVTRHAPDGSLRWVRRLTASASGFVELTEIEMDMHGHVYVGGYYYGHQVQIEDTVLTNGTTPGSRNLTGLLVEYDAEGTLARILQVTGPDYSKVTGIMPMPSGELYVAGFAINYRDGPGHIIVGVDTLAVRPGSSKAFLAKYGSVTTARADEYARPVGSLHTAHYPNPFAGAAILTYELPEASHVRLRVYDVLGREMAMLVDEWHSAGAHSVRLDASSWPSGVYLYRLEAGNQVATGSLVRQK
ncbi:MAG: T9SS type A sorting domain-containing protein [Bacteroidetes bacterium]|nr:T9SS type A sorting domain-containing protein [Bacteroidota bacterium]